MPGKKEGLKQREEPSVVSRKSTCVLRCFLGAAWQPGPLSPFPNRLLPLLLASAVWKRVGSGLEDRPTQSLLAKDGPPAFPDVTRLGGRLPKAQGLCGAWRPCPGFCRGSY